MRIGPLDGVKPSELVDRMNMIPFITADVIIRCVILELKDGSFAKYRRSWSAEVGCKIWKTERECSP